MLTKQGNTSLSEPTKDQIPNIVKELTVEQEYQEGKEYALKQIVELHKDETEGEFQTIELLLAQLEKTNQSVRECQNKLTLALVVVCVAIVLILFIIFKGKGYFSKDEVIIGDTKDKQEFHKEVVELRKIVEEMKTNQNKETHAKK
ncbi:2991_t:CDS:2 [Ambispora gerdemannii]|uniref:2991_t:CDS:1 n=1 Tax=Ambispora gerdemannii TaxID=144530 RepID=A0A9N8Z6P8_9GLOM|nr:2991_t:CDS:2 [Ambispora gerdemannii]